MQTIALVLSELLLITTALALIWSTRRKIKAKHIKVYMTKAEENRRSGKAR